jgi:hypothetical protein
LGAIKGKSQQKKSNELPDDHPFMLSQFRAHMLPDDNNSDGMLLRMSANVEDIFNPIDMTG